MKNRKILLVLLPIIIIVIAALNWYLGYPGKGGLYPIRQAGLQTYFYSQVGELDRDRYIYVPIAWVKDFPLSKIPSQMVEIQLLDKNGVEIGWCQDNLSYLNKSNIWYKKVIEDAIRVPINSKIISNGAEYTLSKLTLKIGDVKKTYNLEDKWKVMFISNPPKESSLDYKTTPVDNLGGCDIYSDKDTKELLMQIRWSYEGDLSLETMDLWLPGMDKYYDEKIKYYNVTDIGKWIIKGIEEEKKVSYVRVIPNDDEEARTAKKLELPIELNSKYKGISITMPVTNEIIDSCRNSRLLISPFIKLRSNDGKYSYISFYNPEITTFDYYTDIKDTLILPEKK